MTKTISKILIANRGEIACRVIKSARKLGIKTVAVYSEIDKHNKNVLMSDEAYCIGKAPSQESYLNQNNILKIARETYCDAIHPGYGFLSENAAFAESCSKNNIMFIGPPASAIKNMGIKSTSKKIMTDAGVPVIPGYHGDDQSNSGLEAKALNVGFPLMIKAIYGGGGKGMRIALNQNSFLSQLESARRESLSSFGNDSVLLERYVVAPRHVEVQIFGDQYGNFVYLNERDCSVQRRHQKIIEEAPAPGIDDCLRKQIGQAAVLAAKAVNYIGAGTVEFIYEESSNSFYFMEMNTRLQVEHPITEMITNTDLVEWQIRVARGEELPLKQEQIPLLGHSVEARIYAEDPYNGFLPGAGHLIYFHPPEEENYVRVETGVRQGDEVSVHYDPMIAKLVVWAENRADAFRKLRNKLLECNIAGLSTNIEFLAALCKNEKLLKGEVNTDFIKENEGELMQRTMPNSSIIAQAALGSILWKRNEDFGKIDDYDPFIMERGFRVGHLYTKNLKFIRSDGKEIKLKIIFKKDGSYRVILEDGVSFDLEATLNVHEERVELITNFGDHISKTKLLIHEENVYLFTPEGSFKFDMCLPKFEGIEDEKHTHDAVAPMPGIVNTVLVKPGDQVHIGDTVMVIIAMKMEHAIKSPQNGIIKEVFFKEGQNVPKNVAVIAF